MLFINVKRGFPMKNLLLVVLAISALALIASEASAYVYGYGDYGYPYAGYGNYGYGYSSPYVSGGSYAYGYGYPSAGYGNYGYGGSAYGGYGYGLRGNIESYNSTALDYYNRPELYNPYVSDFTGFGTFYNWKTAQGLGYRPYTDNRYATNYGGGYGYPGYGYDPYGFSYGYGGASNPYMVGGY